MDRLSKYKLILTVTFRGFLLFVAAVAFYIHDWPNMIFLIFTFLLTFLPDVLQERFEVRYPTELEIMILVFIFFSMYLGELHSFYYVFPWWDVLLHGISGIVVGGIGFTMVFILNRAEKVALKLSPAFVSFFAFCFAMSIGGIWEIFEYGMDSLFGLNMQKSGLVDTMWDLIADLIGAAVFSLIGYLHMKREISIFDKLERRFFKQNPDFKEGS